MDEIMRPRVVLVFKRIYETSRDVLKDLYVCISFVTLRNSEIRMMSWRRLLTAVQIVWVFIKTSDTLEVHNLKINKPDKVF